MGTKQNPDKFNCHAAAAEDEPIFTLLARDPDAPLIVEIWALMRDARKGLSERADNARAVAQQMREWKSKQ